MNDEDYSVTIDHLRIVNKKMHDAANLENWALVADIEKEWFTLMKLFIEKDEGLGARKYLAELEGLLAEHNELLKAIEKKRVVVSQELMRIRKANKVANVYKEQ